MLYKSTHHAVSAPNSPFTNHRNTVHLFHPLEVYICHARASETNNYNLGASVFTLVGPGVDGLPKINI